MSKRHLEHRPYQGQWRSMHDLADAHDAHDSHPPPQATTSTSAPPHQFLVCFTAAAASLVTIYILSTSLYEYVPYIVAGLAVLVFTVPTVRHACFLVASMVAGYVWLWYRKYTYNSSDRAEKRKWLAPSATPAARPPPRRPQPAPPSPSSNDSDVRLPPEWMDDDASLFCLRCTGTFSLLTRRRHHCRACGFLVCGACSSHRAVIPKSIYGKRQVRVCDKCWIDELHAVQ